MPTPRDPAGAAAQVRAALEAVCRRATLRHAVRAAAAALGTVAVALAAGGVAGAPAAVRAAIAIAAGMGAGSFVLHHTRRDRTPRAAAAALERGYPSLRNLAVTAEELIADPDRARPYMWDRVMQAASIALTGVDARRAVPLARDGAALALALGAATAIVLAGHSRIGRAAGFAATREAERTIAIGDLLIDVTAPAYTGRAALRLRNPASIEALAGSVASIRVAGVPHPAARLNGVALAPVADSIQVTLIASGSLAVDAGDRRWLLPLTVAPDRAPDVRVTAPGKDLRVANAKVSIPIHAAAADDIGLRAFELRYTIISGGGEQYSFKEGTLAANVGKDSPRAWSAAATLSLEALKLEPGDALIYRAVAADARPGTAGEASSDTYFVEVAGPGDEALEGIDMPPDRERYALSQAMIVLKIQRLLARERSMPRPEVEEAAAGIAAEQRAVRANFVFLLGGEVEDEVVEAEASHEIQEGRLANQARREIVAATMSMRKVEQELATIAVRSALPPAQDAVRALQRAFGRSRYLLRALPTRIRLDPSRRLSGDLAAARDWPRELAPPAEDRAVAAARHAVAETAAIAGAPSGAGTRERLERLAEEVLAIEPGAADLQDSAKRLLRARDLAASGDAAGMRGTLQEAIAPLLARAQRGRVDVAPVARDAARLAGTAAGGGKPR